MDVGNRLASILAKVNRQVVVGRTHPRDLSQQPDEAQPEASSQAKHALLVPLRNDHVRSWYDLTILDNHVRPGRLGHDLVAADLPAREAKETIVPLPPDVTKKGSDLCSNHGAFPFPSSKCDLRIRLNSIISY